MLVARDEALTGRGTGARINPRLEALAVDVVHEPLHIKELLVREDLAVGVTAGREIMAAVRSLVVAAFPGIVDVDVGVSLRGEAALHHAVGGLLDVLRRY